VNEAEVRLYAMTCGWLTARSGVFLAGDSGGDLAVPVPAYLIAHPKGRVLFDSGMHTATQTDAIGRLGGLSKVFDVSFAPGEEVSRRLETLEVDASRVAFLVNSHLHFDHAGGNDQIPNARWVVQRREWEAAQDDDVAAANGFASHDYDHGHEQMLVDGEHDLFGDGSVVCLPTFGHTPGHQSLRVALRAGPVILTADACYFRKTLEQLALPPVFHDREQMLASLHRLRAWRDAGARLFFGHDPEQWKEVPQAPAQLV
jgi:glyoxylase-like metal-dependent hydrolase (beta-lactamase superfamily II)